tara:strand:+ start:27714 stop:27926 length:213 start_codon:yes stop_codon:yes gene_type:complete
MTTTTTTEALPAHFPETIPAVWEIFGFLRGMAFCGRWPGDAAAVAAVAEVFDMSDEDALEVFKSYREVTK